eukprot:357240-Chlamydomonas_euryale.AAC.10
MACPQGRKLRNDVRLLTSEVGRCRTGRSDGSVGRVDPRSCGDNHGRSGPWKLKACCLARLTIPPQEGVKHLEACGLSDMVTF